jgi:hypothetical protein
MTITKLSKFNNELITNNLGNEKIDCDDSLVNDMIKNLGILEDDKENNLNDAKFLQLENSSVISDK